MGEAFAPTVVDDEAPVLAETPDHGLEVPDGPFVVIQSFDDQDYYSEPIYLASRGVTVLRLGMEIDPYFLETLGDVDTSEREGQFLTRLAEVADDVSSTGKAAIDEIVEMVRTDEYNTIRATVRAQDAWYESLLTGEESGEVDPD